VIPG
jgi:hypothetical protein